MFWFVTITYFKIQFMTFYHIDDPFLSIILRPLVQKLTSYIYSSIYLTTSYIFFRSLPRKQHKKIEEKISDYWPDNALMLNTINKTSRCLCTSFKKLFLRCIYYDKPKCLSASVWMTNVYISLQEGHNCSYKKNYCYSLGQYDSNNIGLQRKY